MSAQPRARSRRRTAGSAFAKPGSLGHGSVSDELFRKFQALIHSETGIWLAPHKTALLIGRLAKRLRALGMSNMSEYFTMVSEPDQHHERMLMIDCITTNETHFFREPRHFEFLAHTAFPLWREQALAGARERRIRVWSAGCSSGEEPFSLAMMLLDHFMEGAGWKLEILATDISMRVLGKAGKGIFPLSRCKEVPANYVNRYLLRGTGEQQGSIKVSPEVQRLVKFERLNLNAASYGVSQPFDVIFLRNVMIYFDEQVRRKVLTQVVRHLSPVGYLFVGHSESLHGLGANLDLVSPGVYANRAGPDQASSHPYGPKTLASRE